MKVMTTENSPIVKKENVQTNYRYEGNSFPILVPTGSFRGAVGMTIVSLIQTARILGREFFYIESTYKGYVRSRSVLFDHAQKLLGVDKVRGMLIDDDIYFVKPYELADAIKKADAEGLNFISPYKMGSGQYAVVHDTPPYSMYTPEEMSRIADWDKVGMAGLGFYYGDIPLSYRFTEESKYGGEDLNFFHDNNIEIRCVDLGLKHIKNVMI